MCLGLLPAQAGLTAKFQTPVARSQHEGVDAIEAFVGDQDIIVVQIEDNLVRP
jgi:hypothetical protein